MLSCSPCLASDLVTPGMSPTDVLALCGEPEGTGRCASVSWWFYGPSRVTFASGAVTEVDPCWAWPQVITPGQSPRVHPALDTRKPSIYRGPVLVDIIPVVTETQHGRHAVDHSDRTQHVSDYRRANGTYVAPYRRRPGQ